jgi:hypothetical protein
MFCWVAITEPDHWEDLGFDGRIMLKFMLHEEDGYF